jgi:hypothetical protein
MLVDSQEKSEVLSSGEDDKVVVLVSDAAYVD